MVDGAWCSSLQLLVRAVTILQRNPGQLPCFEALQQHDHAKEQPVHRKEAYVGYRRPGLCVVEERVYPAGA